MTFIVYYGSSLIWLFYVFINHVFYCDDFKYIFFWEKNAYLYVCGLSAPEALL